MNTPRILLLAAMLGGCATSWDEPARTSVQTAPQASAGTPNAAADLPTLARTVAAQLDAASGDRMRLAAVELELRRISDALPAASAAPRPAATENQTDDAGAAAAAHAALRAEAFGDAPAAGQDTAQAAPEPAAAETPEPYAPAPELSGGRSLFAALTLGAYPNPDTARAAWFGINAAHGAALTDLQARMETTEREGGEQAVVLKAGPLASAGEAESLCARLREDGAVCAAGDFTGEPL